MKQIGPFACYRRPRSPNTSQFLSSQPRDSHGLHATFFCDAWSAPFPFFFLARKMRYDPVCFAVYQRETGRKPESFA
jgi:hypothetical protein